MLRLLPEESSAQIWKVCPRKNPEIEEDEDVIAIIVAEIQVNIAAAIEDLKEHYITDLMGAVYGPRPRAAHQGMLSR